MSNNSKAKKKLPRGVQIIIGVLVVALLASVMTSMFTPSSSNKGSGGSIIDVDKEVVYIPVDFGGRNVGSYSGKISNCVVGAYSLGVAPTSEVKTADIDYFTVDFSISTSYFLGQIYFGTNTSQLSGDNPFSYTITESIIPDENGTDFAFYDAYYLFDSQGNKYYEIEEGESLSVQNNLHVTLIYKVNHEDYTSFECKAYVDGAHVATQTFTYRVAQSLIKYVTLESGSNFDSSFEYLEMNVFDKGYEGPLTEYYNDDTLNLSECTDAYMNYRNNG